MKKESFLRGAMILAVASTISRVVGIIYMVLLPRIIRDDGMGLLQLVKPIHYFAAVLAISGMPVAISKLVAEKAAQGSVHGVLKVFRVALAVLLCTGTMATLGMMAGARYFTLNIAKDPGVYYVILSLAPAVFFLAISGGFRGFFQGLQQMTPTAVSQTTDQVVRVVFTVLFAIWLMPRGVEWGALGAALGSVVGEMVSALVLMGYYFMQKTELLRSIGPSRLKDQESWRNILGRMVSLALPVVIATVLWPIMQMLDTMLIPARMQVAGFTPEQIREGVGYLGMAMTLAQFPNIVTVALATSLIPAIAEATALRNRQLIKRRTEEAMRIGLLFGFPSFIGLYLLAQPLSAMLFNYAAVGRPLEILAVGTLTLGMIQATTGVLQGMGLVMIPVRNLMIGTLFKLACNYYLTALPAIGILGPAWGTTVSWLVAAVLNLSSLARRVGYKINWVEMVLKPVMATIPTGFAIYYVYDTVMLFGVSPLGWNAANTIGCLAAILVAIFSYFAVLMLLGTLTRKDVSLVPKVGEKWADFLYDWGLLRK